VGCLGPQKQIGLTCVEKSRNRLDVSTPNVAKKVQEFHVLLFAKGKGTSQRMIS
jgi:hypothetical protein